MRKFVLSVLAAGALLGAAIGSQAQTLTYTLITGDTPWTTPVGVSGTGAGGPPGFVFDGTMTNLFHEVFPNPVSLGTPTVLNFGIDSTLPGMGIPGSFTNFTAVPVDFHFTLQGTTGPADLFHVTGAINGVLGYRADGSLFSNAAVTFNGVSDSEGNVGVVSVDPNNGRPAFKIVSVVGGQTVNTWVDNVFSKPVPGQDFVPQGFITSGVPEPGTVALLVSSCISGSVFLLRKIRRA